MEIEITHLQIRKITPENIDASITFKYKVNAYNMSGCIDRIVKQPFTTEVLVDLVKKHLEEVTSEPFPNNKPDEKSRVCYHCKRLYFPTQSEANNKFSFCCVACENGY